MAGEPRVVKEMPSVALAREEFERRFRARFRDPYFDGVELEAIVDAAWRSYSEHRKAPRSRKAGPEFADPDYELSLDWLAARDAIRIAEMQHRDTSLPARILVINGSSRTNQSCPGETSKSYRLAKLAQSAIESRGASVDFLDMSVLVSEYGRVIYPCKACVSTAMPLCHWPCSCYPNHGLGQTSDWMHDLYPRWVAAHGVMIVAPVNWYHVPSVLKLMIDRLVCADGGNPDPTRTHGKNAAEAKAIELEGWSYPKHLAGRAFAVAVHGDVAGAGEVKHALCDWLEWMGLIRAGGSGALDRYIGYYEPYATSHDALDRDGAVQAETRNSALALLERVAQIRSGRYERPDKGLEPPRKK
ncbi:MAG TPA: flavodoxin family protein [Gammaproteobacteria bacterium]|nr:flavodoxin family protein [Gammaproteobacteria bacterium]